MSTPTPFSYLSYQHDAMPKRHQQDVIEDVEFAYAREILRTYQVSTIRQHCLANLARWDAIGTRSAIYDEWRSLMEAGSDTDVVAAMTGTNARSKRLRHAPAYVGLLDQAKTLSIRTDYLKAGSPATTVKSL